MNSSYSGSDVEKITNPQYYDIFHDGGSEMQQKVASRIEDFVARRLRGQLLTTKIFRTREASPEKLQRYKDKVGLYHLEDIEPDHHALEVSMRGAPPKSYISVGKYEIQFTRFSTHVKQIDEFDLLSIRLPLMKIIEHHFIKDLQERIDVVAFRHINTALYMATVRRRNELIDEGVLTGDKYFADGGYLMSFLFTKVASAWAGALTYADLNRAGPNESNIVLAEDEAISKEAINNAIKICAFRELKCEKLMMSHATYLDSNLFTTGDAGLNNADEILVKGYIKKTLLGLPYHTTIRKNPYIIPTGVIYSFPDPKYVGLCLTLQRKKFFVKKEVTVISMQAWEILGMGIGNVDGIGCVLLSGARIYCCVNYQDSDGDAVVGGMGYQAIVNDYTQATIPALVELDI